MTLLIAPTKKNLESITIGDTYLRIQHQLINKVLDLQVSVIDCGQLKMIVSYHPEIPTVVSRKLNCCADHARRKHNGQKLIESPLNRVVFVIKRWHEQQKAWLVPLFRLSSDFH